MPMANATFDLTKARTLRRVRRALTNVPARVETNVLNFDLGKARHNLREAELAVEEMVSLLTAKRGVPIDFDLIRKIRTAEKRVKAARSALRTIDPSISSEPF